MNRALFKAACTALFGPQYRSEAARQLKVHLRTVMRWDNGDTKIPRTVGCRLGKLLVQRQAEIGKLLSKLAAERPAV
jgi:hypothetical protein